MWLRTQPTSERAPHMSMEDVPASKVASVSIRSSVMGSKSMVEPGSLSLASTAWRSISAVSSGETGAVGSGIDWMGISGSGSKEPGAACAGAGAGAGAAAASTEMGGAACAGAVWAGGMGAGLS